MCRVVLNTKLFFVVYKFPYLYRINWSRKDYVKVQGEPGTPDAFEINILSKMDKFC